MKKYFLMLLLALTCFAWIEAKDFGKKGQTFEVSEEDLANAIMKRISEKLANPDQDYEKKTEEAIKRAIENPKCFTAVSGLIEATEYRISYYDPVITLEEDIKLPFGKFLAKKGQKIDPTKHTGNPDFGCIFFDSTNPQQLAWAKKQDDFYDWVLVKGNPIELEEQEDRLVYFDQGGELTSKMKVKQIPCRVSPHGKMLKIEEIPLK